MLISHFTFQWLATLVNDIINELVMFLVKPTSKNNDCFAFKHLMKSILDYYIMLSHMYIFVVALSKKYMFLFEKIELDLCEKLIRTKGMVLTSAAL